MAKTYSAQDHRVEGARVTVEVTPIDGVTALNKWSRGEFKPPPTVWVAETRDWVNFANTQANDKTGRDIFLSGGEYRAQPVALSPEVWAVFESRYKALKTRYPNGEISWQQIHDAAISKSWSDLGGRPEWGRFKLVIPHPKRDPAGLAAMVGAAGEYYNRPSVTNVV